MWQEIDLNMTRLLMFFLSSWWLVAGRWQESSRPKMVVDYLQQFAGDTKIGCYNNGFGNLMVKIV